MVGRARPGRPLGVAEAELLARYDPLVRKIAGGFKRKLPRSVLHEDVLAAGMSGLWDAIRRRAKVPPESFEWYVRVRVRGAILDQLRSEDWLPRRARLAAAAAIGTDAYVPPPAVIRFDDLSDWEQAHALTDHSGSEAIVNANEQLDLVQAALDHLPKREREIVLMRYFRGVKSKDLAERMGVSQPRVSQIHREAMGRLRTALVGAPPLPKRKR